MTDILDFQEKKNEIEQERCKRIWTCNCGGRTFFLYENGRVRCNSCDELSSDIFCYIGE